MTIFERMLFILAIVLISATTVSGSQPCCPFDVGMSKDRKSIVISKGSRVLGVVEVFEKCGLEDLSVSSLEAWGISEQFALVQYGDSCQIHVSTDSHEVDCSWCMK